jgi:DNA-binding NarL/FixJ family response regulator
MIHLGIIEDNHTITASLVEYFNNDEQVKVIGTADHVDKFKGEVQVNPDILLLDLSLPFRNGMECIEELCNFYPGVSIIIHSVSADDESIFKCLCSGAHSYLTKGESLSKIKETILTTYAGGSQMSVQIARKVIAHFSKSTSNTKKPENQQLNSRETEVVNLILEGKSYKMVAHELSISINTVRTHIKSIYKKLKINSNIELANIYMKRS